METAESLLHRIATEPIVFQDDKFLVVADILPVVSGHLLLFPKRAVASFADYGVEYLVPLIDEQFAGYDFYEHGRASFCTSDTGPRCAHAHLIPHEANVSATFAGSAVRGANLRGAYLSIPRDAQYLIWRRNGEDAFVLTDVSALPKRAIRLALTERELATF